MDNIQITKDCIQSINNIGSTIYENICNGTLHTVPWGTTDWVLGSIFFIVLGLAIFALVSMVVIMIRD